MELRQTKAVPAASIMIVLCLVTSIVPLNRQLIFPFLIMLCVNNYCLLSLLHSSTPLQKCPKILDIRKIAIFPLYILITLSNVEIFSHRFHISVRYKMKEKLIKKLLWSNNVNFFHRLSQVEITKDPNIFDKD